MAGRTVTQIGSVISITTNRNAAVYRLDQQRLLNEVTTPAAARYVIQYIVASSLLEGVGKGEN